MDSWLLICKQDSVSDYMDFEGGIECCLLAEIDMKLEILDWSSDYCVIMECKWMLMLTRKIYNAPKDGGKEMAKYSKL